MMQPHGAVSTVPEQARNNTVNGDSKTSISVLHDGEFFYADALLGLGLNSEDQEFLAASFEVRGSVDFRCKTKDVSDRA